MAYSYGSSKPTVPGPTGKTEFEILRESHRFLRAEDESKLSWEEKLALKYYNSLFREYAVCDLKHYKTGVFSLRWRTESEVLSGSGETTCGNTRCKHHETLRVSKRPVPLSTLELPFTYLEEDVSKSALIKVVLCEKCCKKLMWKRHRDTATTANVGVNEAGSVAVKIEEDDDHLPTSRRPRSSRSQSPHKRTVSRRRCSRD